MGLPYGSYYSSLALDRGPYPPGNQVWMHRNRSPQHRDAGVEAGDDDDDDDDEDEDEKEEEWHSLGVADLLNADSRPTLILDLDPDDHGVGVATASTSTSTSTTDPLLPIFCNAALLSHERLLDALTEPQHTDPDALALFKAWALSVTTHDSSKDVFPLAHVYANMLWTGATVRRRWRVVSGNALWQADAPVPRLAPSQVGGKSPAPAAAAPGRNESVASRPCLQSRPSVEGSANTATGSQTTSIDFRRPLDSTVTDWTAPSPKGVLTPHMQYARSIDWSKTTLGPMNKWSPELRQLANLTMNNPHPAALFWGTELNMLYNEAYALEVAGNKHPTLMGTGFSQFAELWDYAEPILSECARTGTAVRKENDALAIDRHGLLEETFFSWCFTPLYDMGTHRVKGFYNAPFDTTNMVISQRRRDMINTIGDRTARAQAVKPFWGLVLDGLREFDNDVPFALLYSVGETDEADRMSISSGSTSGSIMALKTCHLEGSIGVPDGHPASPQHLDLKRSPEGFVPAFREAMRTREPTLLRARDATLPESLLDGIEWRGFGDPCREAIIFPVRPTNGETVLAFLVLGVNPRRHYNDEYRAFTSMLNRQLATSLASVMLYEEETGRSRDAAEAAAEEKERLTQQLDLQASRLRRMTELSPLGMFLISPDGLLREANDRFYHMTGQSRDCQYPMSWTESIQPTCADTMELGWRSLVHERRAWSGELQMRKRSTGPGPCNLHGDAIEYWVLFIAQPEMAPDGELRSIMGSITDISHLKWAQGLQNRRLQEAEETRRQQNEFIDITSHEMRNPLSAILQCADDIAHTLAEQKAKGSPPPSDVVESCLDAAVTIALCVQHQKAIVDDILTISKLDSNLLLLTPQVVRPRDILDRAVKMFDPELQAKGIDVHVATHPSYAALAVDRVVLDPSRVLQILINLLTNAIKFTAPAARRLLSVDVGASLTPPTAAAADDADDDDDDLDNFEYVPRNLGPSHGGPPPHGGGPAEQPEEGPAAATAEDWGAGAPLFLRFKVQDTGCGLTAGEKQMLFQRFKQASPRTHAQYGGSGLGLFISRRLAELHGGQIGVASEAGRGSRFEFYVRAQRAGGAPTERPRADEAMGDAAPDSRLAMAPEADESPSPDPTAAPGTTAPATPMVHGTPPPPPDPAPMDVLVVEDNLINQRVLVKQLTKAGCRVSVANDGIEALAFLERTHFARPTLPTAAAGPPPLPLSLILMDLEMPNMDGLTCVRTVRRLQAEGRVRAHVPVIAVTANVRDEQVAAARRAGMDEVVSKPFRIAELLGKMRGVLAGMARGDGSL